MSLVYNYRFGDETSQAPKDIYHPEDTQEPARAAPENSRWWGGRHQKGRELLQRNSQSNFSNPN